MAIKFTKEDAFNFLRNVLKMAQPEVDWKTKSQLEFLANITVCWQEYVPFQNIDQLYLSKTQPRLPTPEEIIQLQMAGKGGVCIHLALFCYLLLSALEYKVHLAIATIRTHHDHAIVIANDLTGEKDDEKSYLIESGCGYPTYRPIPLNSITDSFTTSPVYHDGFLEYTYIKEGNMLLRYQRQGDEVSYEDDVIKNGWRKFYNSDLKPVSVDYLYSSDAKIYETLTNPLSNSTLIRLVRAVRYPREGAIIIRNDKLILYKNNEKVEKSLENINEIKQQFSIYFPDIDVEKINDAYEFADVNSKIFESNLNISP